MCAVVYACAFFPSLHLCHFPISFALSVDGSRYLYMLLVCTVDFRNFDIDFLNTMPCIWPNSVGYYHIWLSTFFMPIIFTACQLVVYAVVVRIQKLRQQPFCKRKGSCARRLCCCCPSHTYDLIQFRHQMIKVRNKGSSLV